MKMAGGSVRAVFEITLLDPPDNPITRLHDAHPALRQESTHVALEAPRFHFGIHRITGPPGAVEALMDARIAGAGPAIDTAVLYLAPREAVFTSYGPPYDPERTPDWENRVDAVAWRLLGQTRYYVETLVGQGRTGRWSLITDNTDALPEFLRTIKANCGESDRAYRLVSLAPYAPEGAGAPRLTARQETALLAAWDQGYYNGGEATLADVADAMGMSVSGVHGLLQRAERAVISGAVDRIRERREPSPGRSARGRQ